MILIGQKDGVVTMEMNRNDAATVAKLVFHKESEMLSLLEHERNIQDTLPEVLLSVSNEKIPTGKLEETEFYLQTETGDLYQINWKQNRPTSFGWVKISKDVYYRIVGTK